jgi:hypothetical protein
MNTQWFAAVNGQQQGPFSTEQLRGSLQNGTFSSTTFVWRQGFSDWQPISHCPELTTDSPVGPPSFLSKSRVDVVDYEIFGSEMQFVEIELDPQESVVAEAGSMMYMSDYIEMETVFGDGSEQRGGSLFDRMLGAGKRLITGEGLFSTVFTYKGPNKGKVAFASPYPGKIIALDLKDYSGKLVCQKTPSSAPCGVYRSALSFKRRLVPPYSEGKALSCKSLKVRAKFSSMPAVPLYKRTFRLGKACALIPDVWWR